MCSLGEPQGLSLGNVAIRYPRDKPWGSPLVAGAPRWSFVGAHDVLIEVDERARHHLAGVGEQPRRQTGDVVHRQDAAEGLTLGVFDPRRRFAVLLLNRVLTG